MTTHLCIVSERLLANLIPALMQRPDRVLLVSSEEMDQRGFTARLQALLESAGLGVAVEHGLPSGGVAEIGAYAERLRDGIGRHSTGPVVLNLTGGNKLMTLVFSQVLGPVCTKMIYTDTANGCLEELPHPVGSSGATTPLKSVLDVPLYLQAQGFRVRSVRSRDSGWRELVQGRRSLTKHLGKHAPSLDEFFGAINGIAKDARAGGNVLVEPRQSLRGVPRGIWADALRRMAASGLLSWDGGTEVTFTDLEGTRYLNGGWLEEYAWLVAQELRPDDVQLGVEGEWEGTERGRNELDVVVVHANRLLYIECKTLRMGSEAEKDSALLYRLDSVGEDVRGLFGEVVLLSAREPSPLIQDRAAHYRIQVVGPERLGRLQRDIRDWMESGRFPSG